ncbi:hypothetical protein BU15DRAFT_79209 [Melanogaster broomeanus]|nr:hypothetical protein BU15DRAFT_79209 [Melanogaster broomeanus]
MRAFHVLRKPSGFLLLRLALTTVTPKKHRGRPTTRASLTLTAVSPDSSPERSPCFSNASPLRRVLSPPSWFECDGTCKQPMEEDRDRAHVVNSLSACKDNERAFDDNQRKGTVTKFFVDHLRENPKSTLLELLTAIRKRVDEISQARQELNMQTNIVSRLATFEHGSKTNGKRSPVRRDTIYVHTLEDYLRATMPSVREEDGSDVSTLGYSQKPGYASHYRLDLNEPIDL